MNVIKQRRTITRASLPQQIGPSLYYMFPCMCMYRFHLNQETHVIRSVQHAEVAFIHLGSVRSSAVAHAHK